MRILLIGGTQFVGRAIAAEALARGHEVTVFHRGTNPADGLDGALVIHGDRDTDLSGLAAGEWDATVDVCAYRPGQVDSLAAALGTRGGRHVFISTVSVYAEDIAPNCDESARLVSLDALSGLDTDTCDITNEAYGPLKVLCEQRIGALHPDALVIRPTYVVGPRDHTMRFPAWVERIAAGGVVDAPEPRDNALQYIDARDQGTFVVDLLEQGVSGTFHTAAPPTTFGEMIDTLAAAVGGPDLEIRWVQPPPADAESGKYPLWSGLLSDSVLQMDPGAALGAGLSHRPLAQTATDTLAWLGARAVDPG